MNKHNSNFLLLFFLLFSLSLTAQEFGLASYYSDKYDGRETAYGDTYDKTKMTCSHKKHPYGTLLKVTRLDNNKSVVCRVIDKGPYTRGRIVDLSRAAAVQIDLIDDGVAEVKVEVVNRETSPPASPPVATQQPAAPADDRTVLPQAQTPAQPSVTPPPATQPAVTPPAPAVATTPAPAPQGPEADPNKLVGQDYSKYGLYRIRVERGPENGFAVQVMVVSDYEKVIKAIASLQARHFDDIFVSVEQGQTPEQTLYKLLLGKFETEAQAQNYQENLKNKYKINGFVVSLEEKNTPAGTAGNE